MPELQEADAASSANESAISSRSITRLEEGNLRRNSLPPIEAPGNRLCLVIDDREGSIKGRKGSTKSNGGGGKKVRRLNSGDSLSPFNGDNLSPLNNADSSDSNSMGGGLYAGNTFQATGPLSSPPLGDDAQFSPAGSDAGGDGKDTEGGDTVGAEVEECGGARVVNSTDRRQKQDRASGSTASKDEWANNAVQDMDTMREGIQPRKSANGSNGSNGARIGSAHEAPRAGKESGDGATSTEAVGVTREDGGMEEGDEDSAQRLFIGWMQARQRECVTLVSLGCVAGLFVNHVSSNYSGTLPMMATFIPLAVHLLLVRDIYVKWEGRQRRRAYRYATLSDRKGSGTEELKPPAVTAASGGVVHGPDGVQRLELTAEGLAERAGTGVQQNGSGGGGGTGGSLSSNDSNFPAGVRQASSTAGTSDQEDLWSDFGGRSGSESMNVMSFLETPFQKSTRLLNTACENVHDPIVRNVLKTIAKLLSDPDSLHQVKEGSIRKMTMDLGTRNYIENVLQTPVKATSAEDNWKKLRTGMFVVRAMAREAAAAEDFLSAYKSRHTTRQEERTTSEADPATSALAKGIDESKKNELDDLLEDIESGLDTTSQEVVTLNTNGASRAELSAEEIEWNRFSRCNRNLIQGQQLVAKTLSRGDLRKDPDRLSVKELRDLVSERRPPTKIDEDSRHVECVSDTTEVGVFFEPSNPLSDDPYETMKIPRLPSLEESSPGSVASLLAGGGFLKWDFNVFALEERSQGHSLWFAAMLAFSHYNIIGAFGLSVDRLSQLFLYVEASYCYAPEAPNTYHTHVHAADVTLTVSHFLSVEAIANRVRSTHGLALLMAAIMHDYRHPGVNNGYLVHDLDPLAVVYNDASVLENFHAAEGFKMLLLPAFDIFRGWKPEDVKFFRHAFVKCILATDLALSLEYVSKFQSLTTNMMSAELARSTEKGGAKLGGSEINSNNSIPVQILVLQMVLKVADVAHPCKPWEVHHKWSELVTEEFFKQGDKEAARGLAVSPLCDRRDQNLPKSQCDFIDFIVRPCVSIFSMYCKVTTWSDQLDSNFRRWKNLYEEQGGQSLSRPTSPGSKRRSLR